MNVRRLASDGTRRSSGPSRACSCHQPSPATSDGVEGDSLYVSNHDSIVNFLGSRLRDDGLIDIGEPPQPGERVVIQDGPFAALVGIVERFVSDRERVIALLASVRIPVRLGVEARVVRRLPASAWR